MWPCRIFLVFHFLFYLIIVILVLDFCPHSTSPMYSGWLFYFLIKIFVIYQKKKLLHAEIYKAGSFFSLVFMQTGNQFLPFCFLTKIILVIAYVWNKLCWWSIEILLFCNCLTGFPIWQEASLLDITDEACSLFTPSEVHEIDIWIIWCN